MVIQSCDRKKTDRKNQPQKSKTTSSLSNCRAKPRSPRILPGKWIQGLSFEIESVWQLHFYLNGFF